MQLFSFLHSTVTKDGGARLHAHDDVRDFYAGLTQGLQELHEALGPEFITIEWLKKAVDFMRTSHASVLALVDKLHLPLSSKGEEWMNEYMDETVKLLDVANAVKKGVAGLENYLMQLETLWRTVETRPRGQNYMIWRARHACKDEMVRLEHENKRQVETRVESDGKLFLNLSDKHIECKFSKWSRFWGVMYSWKNSNSFISRLLIWGIVHAGSSHTMKTENIALRSPWATCLLGLQQKVNKELDELAQQSEKMIFLWEFNGIQSSLADLEHRLSTPEFRNPLGDEDLGEFVREAKQRCGDFKSCLEAVDWHVNDLFDEVVEGRNKLLRVLNNCS